MNPYRGLVQALGKTRAFSWVASRVLPSLDAPFAGRRRSPTSFGTGFPLCYLTTTGRASGELRTVPLLYVADGKALVVFASNWGKRRHPAWALNLEAEPCATVSVDGVSRDVVARRASSEEERQLWPAAERVYPGYAGYRERAGREIRVFVLEPRDH